MTAPGPMTVAARAVAAAIRHGVETAQIPPVTVAAVTDDTATPTAPFVAVMPPSIDSGSVSGLRVSRATARVPLRVAAATATDAAGLVALADSVLAVLLRAGMQLDSIGPTVIAAGAATLPGYDLSVLLVAEWEL